MTRPFYLHQQSILEQRMLFPGTLMTTPFLCWLYHPGSLEEIEDHLSENASMTFFSNRYFKLSCEVKGLEVGVTNASK